MGKDFRYFFVQQFQEVLRGSETVRRWITLESHDSLESAYRAAEQNLENGPKRIVQQGRVLAGPFGADGQVEFFVHKLLLDQAEVGMMQGGQGG